MSNRPTPSSPGPDAEDARRAYLDLLKLALCDLVAPETETVYTSDRGPVALSLPEDEISRRVEGREWPRRGLTMIGYDRLVDLQRCVEAVVAEGIEGEMIESGVWRGGAAILIRATLDTLGEPDRTVWLADSFRGLPDPDTEAFPEDRNMELHVHDYLAVPQAEVHDGFRRLGLDHDLEFVEGFFSDTLPTLAGRCWSLIRLDGDMYESTWVTLESLYPGLAKGGFVVVDDHGEIEECARAISDFREAYGITTPLEHVDHTCVRWRREDDPAPTVTDRRAPTRRRRSPVSDEPVSPRRMLTQRELELERRTEELERALADSQSQATERAECIIGRNDGSSSIWAADDLLVVDTTEFTVTIDEDVYEREDSRPSRFVLVKTPAMVNRLATLVAEINPNRLVDLGIFKGGSTALLALLARPQKLTAIELDSEPVIALDEFIVSMGLSDVVSTHYGVDQSDLPTVASRLRDDHDGAPLDLIVDDASHLYPETRASFELLFPHLRPGGVYVMEDWNWAHKGHPLRQYKGGWFHDRPALTNLIVEFMMIKGTTDDLISKVAVFRDSVELTRGPVHVDAPIRLEEHYNSRGLRFRPLL